MAARFFVDENDLALGKLLAQHHHAVAFPGHPSLREVPRGSLDEEWLPVVGAQALVVITRDRRIRYRPVEKHLWLEYRVRGFVLTGRRSQSTTDSLAVLEKHWTRIETLVVTQPDGPWMYAVTNERFREISLL